MVELELELNYRLKSLVGIELSIVGPESELNLNRLLPELHITGMYNVPLLYIISFIYRTITET